MPVGTLAKHSLKGFTLKTDMYRLLRSLCSLAITAIFAIIKRSNQIQALF